MPQSEWLRKTSPAFQLMIASSWIAPDSHRDIQDRAVQRACYARPNWTEYLDLVDRHRTPGSSWAALKRTAGVHVPEQVARELQRRSDLCRWQAMLHLQLLAGILKRLNQSGIPVMPLKGPLLSFALYRDAGLRHSRDLDILVPQPEIHRAQECLENMGWRLGAEYFSLSPRQWEASFQNEHDVGYVEPQQRCQLELHWQWHSAQKTEQYWARSTTKELSGFSYRAMSRADLPIYLSDHGGAHQWFRAKWLGDLARLHCNGQVDWIDALARARALGQERSMLLGLLLFSECYDLELQHALGSLRKTLPHPLASTAVRALTARNPERNAWTALKEGVQTYRYHRVLWPDRSWSKNLIRLTHCRHDFKILPLPDGAFWLYAPLRPFLWAWRHITRTSREHGACTSAKHPY